MISIERYLVFVGENFYPSAWSDYFGKSDSLKEAIDMGKREMSRKSDPCGCWYQVIDLQTMNVVKEESCDG